MSQRLGMADGRCTTIFESGRLFNDDIYKKANIDVNDSYTYRQYLQHTDTINIVPEPTCALFSYVKGYDIVEDTNVMSQNEKDK
jgi:hypothetical protein